MIKAVIFDIGGVLYSEKAEEQYPILAKWYGCDLKKFYASRRKYLKKAQTGKISIDNYLKKIAKDLGIKKFRNFKKNWIKIRTKILKKDKEVEAIILKLKKNYVLGTLTNIISLHHKIRLKKKAYKYFKIKLISCKEGLRKPEMKFYKLLLNKTRLKPEEIIFIDDENKYLVPAKNIGIKTILFKNANQLKRDLKKFKIII